MLSALKAQILKQNERLLYRKDYLAKQVLQDRELTEVTRKEKHSKQGQYCYADVIHAFSIDCLLYTSDAADELMRV